jgi:hypothetical protein
VHVFEEGSAEYVAAEGAKVESIISQRVESGEGSGVQRSAYGYEQAQL